MYLKKQKNHIIYLDEKQFENSDLEKFHIDYYAQEKYQEIYKKDSKYFSEVVRNNRKKFIERFLPIAEVFDYGCSVSPSTPNCYDKYVKDYSKFDLELFSKCNGILFADVIEHVIDWEFLRFLPQKYLFITIPIVPFEFEKIEDLKKYKHKKDNEHLHYFTEIAFVDYVRSFGWNLVYSGTDECPPRQDIGSFVFERGDL